MQLWGHDLLVAMMMMMMMMMMMVAMMMMFSIVLGWGALPASLPACLSALRAPGLVGKAHASLRRRAGALRAHGRAHEQVVGDAPRRR